ncbi:MAG: hypothetical protein H6Q37_1074 [Chloroflexi bacterium]|nr:hypothetical protein [Chloroflexota bacterium]
MESARRHPDILIFRYTLRESMGLVITAIALFWSAGRLDWWAAWATLALLAGWVAATGIVILRYNPDLLKERLGPRRGAKRWDTAIIGALGLIELARYIIAGLDQRYGWTGDFPLTIQVCAFILCALGYALFVWSTASNAYFSQVVRIQTERGQKVVSTGPYHYVRHPGYAGAIIAELSVAVLLDSWAALAVSFICVVLLIIRTALEDRTLQGELDGYPEFSKVVQYRLAPGIW